MPAALVVLLSITLVGVALRARLKPALATTIGTVLLVPGTLVIPNGVTSLVTLVRAVSLALLVNVVARVVRGDLNVEVFRPRRVHAALGVLIFVGMINGVAFADPQIAASVTLGGFLLVVDQLVFLVAVLAVLRAIDDVRFAVAVTVAALAASTGIATWEWFSHESWAAFLIRDLPSQQAGALVQGLETRAGEVVRVRGANAFALAFGWVQTLLFPLAIVTAARARHKIWWLLPVLVALTVYWSNARSAVVGLALGAVVLVALARFDRPTTRLVAAAALVGVAVLVVTPSVRDAFTVAEQTGSIDVRLPRLKEAASVTAGDPYTGLGFRGLAARDVPIVDTSYMLTYGELGVLGLVAFLTVLIGGVASCTASLRAPPGRDRTIAAAVTTGAALTLMATGAYGLFARPSSFRVFWLLVAIGIVLGERYPTSATRPRVHVGGRLAVVAVALLVGLVSSAATRDTNAETIHFSMVPPAQTAAADTTFAFPGQVLIDTACRIAPTLTDADVDCTRLGTTLDLGRLRIEETGGAATAGEVTTVVAELSDLFPGFRVFPADGVQAAQPTWGRTAPLALPLAAAMAVIFVPPLPLEWARRRYVAGARGLATRKGA